VAHSDVAGRSKRRIEEDSPSKSSVDKHGLPWCRFVTHVGAYGYYVVRLAPRISGTCKPICNRYFDTQEEAEAFAAELNAREADLHEKRRVDKAAQ
jgi:hypothetical protein